MRQGRSSERDAFTDARIPIPLPLSSAGWKDVTLEPRFGYVSWRCREDETGEVLRCMALKELLRWIARQVPRQAGIRSLD